NATPPTQIYTLSLHDALPISGQSEQSASGSRRSGNSSQGLRSLRDLTQHLTTRADDSHAAPVQGVPFGTRRLSPPTQCMSRPGKDRKSTRLNSSHDQISYAVF